VGVIAIATALFVIRNMMGNSEPANPVRRTALNGIEPSGVAIDAPSGQVFIVGYDGRRRRVWTLDAASGEVLPTDENKGAPVGILVDARVGRSLPIMDDGTSTTGWVRAIGVRSFLYTITLGGKENVATGAFIPVREIALSQRFAHLFVPDDISGVDPKADGMVSTRDATTGRLLKRIRMGHRITGLSADDQSGHVFGIDSSDASIGMLNARTGAALRTTRVGSGRKAPGFLAVDGATAHVFVAEYDGTGAPGQVAMIDARTGLVLRAVAVGRGTGDLAVDSQTGRVFVVNSLDDSVSMLDARTGQVLRTMTVGRDPVAIALDRHSHRVFVVNNDNDTPHHPGLDFDGPGSVRVLDAWSGTVVDTIAVGFNPQAIQIDERTGRAFVLNYGTANVPQRLPTGADQWQWWPSWLRGWGPFPSQFQQSYRSAIVPGSVSVLATGHS